MNIPENYDLDPAQGLACQQRFAQNLNSLLSTGRLPNRSGTSSAGTARPAQAIQAPARATTPPVARTRPRIVIGGGTPGLRALMNAAADLGDSHAAAGRGTNWVSPPGVSTAMASMVSNAYYAAYDARRAQIDAANRNPSHQ